MGLGAPLSYGFSKMHLKPRLAACFGEPDSYFPALLGSCEGMKLSEMGEKIPGAIT